MLGVSRTTGGAGAGPSGITGGKGGFGGGGGGGGTGSPLRRLPRVDLRSCALGLETCWARSKLAWGPARTIHLCLRDGVLVALTGGGEKWRRANRLVGGARPLGIARLRQVSLEANRSPLTCGWLLNLDCLGAVRARRARSTRVPPGRDRSVSVRRCLDPKAQLVYRSGSFGHAAVVG